MVMVTSSVINDELFDVRNSFYIGNYQQCINEAQKVKVSCPELQLDRDFYLYMSYIAQKKYMVVIDEIKESSPAELQCVKGLAQYMSSSLNKSDVLQTLVAKYGRYEAYNSFAPCIIATLYLYEEDIENALAEAINVPELEAMSLVVQIYLRMNRLDLACKELAKMQKQDEDATLTQLAQAWINIATQIPEKLQDAYYIFQELIDKYGSTSTLLNAQAVCFICQQKYTEAESALQESMVKDSNNCDALVNSIVLSGYLKKPPEIANRYMMQLKDSYADSKFVKDYLSKELEFDNLCREYEVPTS